MLNAFGESHLRLCHRNEVVQAGAQVFLGQQAQSLVCGIDLARRTYV